MSLAVLLTVSSLFAAVYGQSAGTNTKETHPKLDVQKCTKSGCTKSSQSIVLDSNWRWTHTTQGYTNCYTGNDWNKTSCPDGASCVKNCVVDGADYTATYGITTSGDALTLKFVTKGQYSTNIGSRVYLMDAQDKGYEMFKMVNKEFSFDVDVSKMPCGLNGALYFTEMLADGGLSKYPAMKAGAKYGMGYCDAQCPKDLKFLYGTANVDGWKGQASDANAGNGKYGSCCNEMDLWEANNIAAAYTPHPCNKNGPTQCTDGTDCDKICDQPGCDFNSWRMGDKSFYGPGMTVDTNKKFTVVTQFINDASGTLTEIKRKYVQGGKVIENSQATAGGLTGNSLTDDWCAKQKTAFGDKNMFADMGGLKVMGGALSRGMVLVMSIWDDHFAKMLWLDADYPVGGDATKPGVNRGSCDNASGDPKDVESKNADAQVIYSNIRFGDLDSTYGK